MVVEIILTDLLLIVCVNLIIVIATYVLSTFLFNRNFTVSLSQNYPSTVQSLIYCWKKCKSFNAYRNLSAVQ
jgi:hypothetical protein